MPLWAQTLLRLALGILDFLRRERARADHAADVRADPGTGWLRRFGGTDRRATGAPDTGSRRD